MGAILGMVAWMAGCGSEGAPEAAHLGEARQAVESGVDFAVTGVSGPASVQRGGTFTTTVTVCNQGSYGDSTEVALYVSSDASIVVPNPPSPTADQHVASVWTQHLNPGQCQTLSLTGSANVSEDGAYYLGAVADPFNYSPEGNEDNNTQVGNRIGIGDRADFIVTTVTGPASVQPGQTFTASVVVCNQGTYSDGAQVELYLSSDASIVVPNPPGPTTDQPVATQPTAYLAPGQCQTLSMQGSAHVPEEGAYYLGAVVDPFNQRPELIEDNNAQAGTRMGIGMRADFIVSTVTGPASVQPGQAFTASVQVCNQGTYGESTQVELYLSSDNVITVPNPPGPGTDQPVANAATQYLQPGQCETLSLSGSANVPEEGAYYLGAVADPFNQRPELIEDNNAKAGTLMSIRY